jgi:hypothetical protein
MVMNGTMFSFNISKKYFSFWMNIVRHLQTLKPGDIDCIYPTDTLEFIFRIKWIAYILKSMSFKIQQLALGKVIPDRVCFLVVSILKHLLVFFRLPA